MNITASWEFSGLSDYWTGNGRRWDDDAACVFASVGPNTTFAELIDQWMADDCDMQEKPLFQDASDDDIRAALVGIFVDGLDLTRRIELAESMRAELGHAEHAEEDDDGPCETCDERCSGDYGGELPQVIALIEIEEGEG